MTCTAEININNDDGREYIFSHNISNNVIEILLEDTHALMTHTFIDYDFVALYFVILKNMVTTLTQLGCTTFSQIVTTDDYNNFLKSDCRWTMINLFGETETVMIQCDIKDVIECMCTGLNLKI